MQHVLGFDPEVSAATDAYYDDVVVDTRRITVERVMEVLEAFGLEAKPPIDIDGGRVLGLAVRSSNCELHCERVSAIPVTRRLDQA